MKRGMVKLEIGRCGDLNGCVIPESLLVRICVESIAIAIFVLMTGSIIKPAGAPASLSWLLPYVFIIERLRRSTYLYGVAGGARTFEQLSCIRDTE